MTTRGRLSLWLGPFQRLGVYVRPHVPMLVLGASLALVVSAT